MSKSIVWDVVVVLVAFWIASFIFSFILSQIMISLGCSKPLTQKLRIMFGGAADYKTINKKINTTIFINLLILAAISAALVWWGNTQVLIGSGIALVLTFFKVVAVSGMSNANVSDYISAYFQESDEEFKQMIVKIFVKE